MNGEPSAVGGGFYKFSVTGAEISTRQSIKENSGKIQLMNNFTVGGNLVLRPATPETPEVEVKKFFFFHSF